MHVIAFAAALRAEEDRGGGVKAEGFPLTSATVAGGFPSQITIPLVLAVYSQGGTDHDPVRYVVARTPKGERIGSLKVGWNWPDTPGTPIKYRVFALHLPILVQSPGLHSIALHNSLEEEDTEHVFPLPVLAANPLMSSP